MTAYLIESTLLGEDIWLADTFPYLPGDGLVVFYFDEIPELAKKTPEQLKNIHAVKKTFGGGRVITKKKKKK